MIFDQLDYSPILNDEDIVIIGPESVRAVIHEKENNCSIGYLTHRGKYVTFDKAGTPHESGDKTIHSLLRDILVSNDKLFNRLLFDPDETGHINILLPIGTGYTKAFNIGG